MTESIILGNLSVGKKKPINSNRSPPDTKKTIGSIKPVRIKTNSDNATKSKSFLRKKSTLQRASMNFNVQPLDQTKQTSSEEPKPRFVKTTSHSDKPTKDHKANINNSIFKTSRLFDESSKEIKQVEPISVDSKCEELFSNVNFSEMAIHKLIVSCLDQRFGLSEATSVQALSIPPLLEGRDALIKSATGSGKTLAYAIPMVHYLQALEPNINRKYGLHSVIILPTRELALQTYECLDKLLQPFRRIVLGLLVGGEKKKSEKARIRKGLNILVCTPGRLLDHLEHTKSLYLINLKWLVIDEADRLYEQGFSAIIAQIIEHIQKLCPTISQTVLLSATLSEGVKELAGLSLKNPAIIDVGTSEHRLETIALPTSLRNCFLVVPPKLRLVTLACILIDAFVSHSLADISKIIVFMSCQDVVDFYCTLLNETLPKVVDNVNSLKILQLRGNMNQTDRKEVFRKFHSTKCGILFCTDVASRGLDLPNVDLVVQMSMPALVEDYVHRVGRTARAGAKGQSILFVLPSETQYISYLQEQISINIESLKLEDTFKCVNLLTLTGAHLNTDQERLAHLQQMFEKAIYDDETLHQVAVKAYLSHLRAYASYPHKMSPYLPFKMLHLGHIAKSFALRESPTELGAKFQRVRKSKNKIQDIGSMKRKIVPLEDRVSEFSGGSVSTTKKLRRK